MVNETVVEVLPSQVGVTSSSLDFEDTFFDSEKGDIERSSAKVEDEDIALPRNLLVETICNSSGSGFVDDTKDVKTGDGTSVLGCLTLGVVEISRDSDDSVSDSVAQIRLGSLLHLEEDHGGNFFRGLSRQSEGGLISSCKALTNSLVSPRYSTAI